MAGLASACALACVALSACGSSGAASSAGPSAQALLTSALRNAVASRGVHESVHEDGSGVSVTMTNDIGSTSGRQAIDANGGHSVVIVAGGRAYFRGDATALAGYYQFPAAAADTFAGKWIAMRPGDPGYGDVSGAVTLASDFGQFSLNAPLTKRPVTLPDGQRAIAIVGTEAGPTGATVPATLYVTATGVTLPIELRAGNQQISQTVIWADWGRPVSLAAPSGAVAFSTLGLAPGGAGIGTPAPTRV